MIVYVKATDTKTILGMKTTAVYSLSVRATSTTHAISKVYKHLFKEYRIVECDTMEATTKPYYPTKYPLVRINNKGIMTGKPFKEVI